MHSKELLCIHRKAYFAFCVLKSLIASGVYVTVVAPSELTIICALMLPSVAAPVTSFHFFDFVTVDE